MKNLVSLFHLLFELSLKACKTLLKPPTRRKKRIGEKNNPGKWKTTFENLKSTLTEQNETRFLKEILCKPLY